MDEESGLIVFLGAEFHPPAPPPQPVEVNPAEDEEIDEPQPLVPGQPTATGEIPIPEPPPKVQRRPRAPRKQPAPGSEGQKKRSYVAPAQEKYLTTRTGPLLEAAPPATAAAICGRVITGENHESNKQQSNRAFIDGLLS